MDDYPISLIEETTNKLIEFLPNTSKNIGKIDLVLESGAFNGSYLVGALFFLKEMEKKKYIYVDRISGCSIGALIGFLYFINSFFINSFIFSEVPTGTVDLVIITLN